MSEHHRYELEHKRRALVRHLSIENYEFNANTHTSKDRWKIEVHSLPDGNLTKLQSRLIICHAVSTQGKRGVPCYFVRRQSKEFQKIRKA